MHNVRIVLFFFLIGSVLGALWINAKKTNHQNSIQKKIKLVCTTGMIADTIKNIASDAIDLYCLMGPGVDPHLYRPTQGDMHVLSQADIILYNGLHLEGKMTELFANMQQQKPTYAVTSILRKEQLLAAYGSSVYDPHIWHDVRLWIEIAKYIQQILQQHDPEHNELYKKNAEKYISTLQKLDAYVRLKIQKIPEKQRILVTAHDAFRYFGRSYGIRVVGLQGTSTDSEISTRNMQELADFIVKHKIPAIFVESSVPHRSIFALQQAVLARDWKVIIGPDLYSDALADNKDTATYSDMIQHNVDAIVSALQ